MESKDVAQWHRSESKKHQDIADFHKRTADALESTSMASQYFRAMQVPQSPARDISVQELNRELFERRGRVAHIAQRLQTSEEVITKVLKDPQCDYIIGPRGFVYHRKDPNIPGVTEDASQP
jgi:hypothetical protein